MNATNIPPIVLVALDAARGAVLTSLSERYPACQARVDDCDVINSDTLASNQVLRGLMRKTKDMGGRLHLIGLVSDGGVHGALAHMLALIEIAKSAQVRVVVHALLDGVDVPVHSAARFVTELEGKLDAGIGRIGSVSGRAFAMDCETRWDRIEKVYKAMLADGVERSDSALRGIQTACAFGNPEAFVKPFVAFDYPGVSLVDTALPCHFTADGARQLSEALAGASFRHFSRKAGRAPFAGRFVCMTPYDNSLSLPTLFPRAPDPMSLPLEALASAGYKQFHGTDGHAVSIANTTAAAISSREYPFVLADFANPDNPSRSGSAAALQGAVAKILDAAHSVHATVIIMGGRDAADSFPLIYIDAADSGARLRDHGKFSDLGPTLLELMKVPAPPDQDMEGVSLLTRDYR